MPLQQLFTMTRPVDTRHKPMSLHNRAAQFAPFDALTGFGGRIHEVSRITQDRIHLSEEMIEEINEQLQFLNQHKKEEPIVTVTFFVPDLTKAGGSYETVTSTLQNINVQDERLILEDDLSIAFDDILGIQSDS